MLINRIVLFSLIALTLGFFNGTNRPEPVVGMAMCAAGAPDQFAALSNDPAFGAAHPSPEAVEVALKGKMVEFSTPDGTKAKAYRVNVNKKNKGKYLLVFHEWWGLNDYVRKESDYWSKELGITVLALDLYDGKVAATADQATALMQGLKAERAKSIIAGAQTYVGQPAEFYTMGWCMGGGWSMQAALQLSPAVKGCVMYYGMPESNMDKLRTLSSDVLFIHASRDPWINDEVVSTFEKNMQSAGKGLTVKRYDADHAFANPSSPKFNEEARNGAKIQVKRYLGGKLN